MALKKAPGGTTFASHSFTGQTLRPQKVAEAPPADKNDGSSMATIEENCLKSDQQFTVKT